MDIRRDVFQAIADPTRRAILTMLALQTMTAGAIALSFDSKRQTVSKHIQILTECQLLKQRQAGREIYYELNAQKMKEIDLWLETFRKIWEQRFDKMDNLFKQNKNKKK